MSKAPLIRFTFYGTCRTTGRLRQRNYFATLADPDPGGTVRKRAAEHLADFRLMSAGICRPDKRSRAIHHAYP